MSGTSLDGLDICWVRFSKEDYSVFEIVKAVTISYPKNLNDKLANAYVLSGIELMNLNNEFAVFCAEKVNVFLGNDKGQIDFMASHGHTVFHNPKEGLTTQIGSGAVLYAQTGIKTICDFRSVDVALGGQGAPLVPVGDQLLFKDYDSCLNLGGIANISIQTEEGIEAQDLCFANMLSNHICQKFLSVPYDEGGKLGSKGEVDFDTLDKMEAFHQHNRSLAREDFNCFLETLPDRTPENLLRTSYEYTAAVIAKFSNSRKSRNILVTGGGAHNSFFMTLLKQKTNADIIIPSAQIIDFKEALIFAFLGLLRTENKNNSLKEVTQSLRDNLGGAIYGA